MAETLAERGRRAAGTAVAGLRGRRRRLARRRSTAAAGHRRAARNLPGLGRAASPLADELARAARRARSSIENDVQVATNAEFALGAGREYQSLLGVFWGTGVGGGIVLRRRAVDVGRGARGRDRPRRRQDRRRARAPAGAAAAWRPTRAARRDRGSGRASASSDGHKTDLFEIMEERGRDRLTSGDLVAGARAAATSSRRS